MSIGIDEQIAYQEALGYKDETRAAILSTLQRMKAIKDAIVEVRGAVAALEKEQS